MGEAEERDRRINIGKNITISAIASIMYIPNAFREGDIEKLVAFMRSNSFATLVSVQNQVPVASHIPLVVSE